MYHKNDWHAEVYNKVEVRRLDDLLRLTVIDRDNYNCVVCGSRRRLEVHHIMPRSKGGGDNKENLVTLCYKCHNEVEEEEYTTLAQIKAHSPSWKDCDSGKVKRKRVAWTPKKTDQDAGQADWRTWVYGG